MFLNRRYDSVLAMILQKTTKLHYIVLWKRLILPGNLILKFHLQVEKERNVAFLNGLF